MKEVLKNSHIWRFQKLCSHGCELWVSGYFSSDGDQAELYIREDKSGFDLFCFSGIPVSNIFIDSVDFGVFQYAPNKIDDLDFSEPFNRQSIKIADYLCGKFCEYSEYIEKTEKT